MLTQFFFAHSAGQRLVGLGGEALWIKTIGDFPFDQDDQGQDHQAAGVGALDKDQRGTHHGKVPIVNAAGAATAVAHEPGFKGTEPKDADHIADAVGQADQYQDTLIDNIHIIEQTNGTI